MEGLRGEMAAVQKAHADVVVAAVSLRLLGACGVGGVRLLRRQVQRRGCAAGAAGAADANGANGGAGRVHATARTALTMSCSPAKLLPILKTRKTRTCGREDRRNGRTCIWGCRGAEGMGCRGAEVQRCRGAEVQRCEQYSKANSPPNSPSNQSVASARPCVVATSTDAPNFVCRFSYTFPPEKGV